MDDEAPTGRGDRSAPAPNPVADALFDLRLAEIRARETERIGRRNLWLAHHWPDAYAERCVRIGHRWVCRRCAALYPLGFLVALLSAGGLDPWPRAWDPWPVWVLSVPATVAYAAEAVELVGYRPRWQVATTLLAAVAFGRALGYELMERWQPVFWGPITVFGGIWFLATVYRSGARSGRRRSESGTDDAQRAATATSSSSAVL
jgi:hypothetical protein